MTTLLSRLWKLKFILATIFLIANFSFISIPKALAFDASTMAPDAPMSLEKYMGANDGFADTVFNSLNVRIVGSKEAQIQGAIPVETRYLAMMMTDRPASTSQYIAHLMNNIGFPTTPTAHAQGLGYRMFSPVIKLWQIFRNLAYTIYILIFLVIGFMIMFRTKINAQTVISIQSALPNLIITLILITFSYAIAGFLIDIMYFLIYFLVYLAGSNGLLNAKMTMNYFLKHSLVGIFIPSGQSDVVLHNISISINSLLWGLLGKSHAGGGIGSSLLQLIVSFTVFVQLGRLLFSLLKNYLMVIIQIITAPIQLLPNAIPGSKAFMTWLKTLASYLAPFPIITALFLMAIIFATPAGSDNPFGVSKPIFSNTTQLRTFPYISNVSTTSYDVANFIAFALILIAPAAAKMAQDFFKVKESPYASEVMSGLGIGFKAATWLPSTLWNAKEAERRARLQAKYYNRATGKLDTISQGINSQASPPGERDQIN